MHALALSESGEPGIGQCSGMFPENQSLPWAGSASALRALAATKALDGVVLGRVSPGVVARTRNRRSVSPRVRAEQSEGSGETNDRGTEASVSKSVVGRPLGWASVAECHPTTHDAHVGSYGASRTPMSTPPRVCQGRMHLRDLEPAAPSVSLEPRSVGVPRSSASGNQPVGLKA